MKKETSLERLIEISHTTQVKASEPRKMFLNQNPNHDSIGIDDEELFPFNENTKTMNFKEGLIRKLKDNDVFLSLTEYQRMTIAEIAEDYHKEKTHITVKNDRTRKTF